MPPRTPPPRTPAPAGHAPARIAMPAPAESQVRVQWV